jgi:hypothetical protein
MKNIKEIFREEASAWEGVTILPHRFGGIEFRLNKAEIGHLHNNGLLDIPFPTRIRNQLIKEGKALPHHVLPDSGWISFFIKNKTDIENGIRLLRLSYLRYILIGNGLNEEINDLSYKDQVEGLNLSPEMLSIIGNLSDRNKYIN